MALAPFVVVIFSFSFFSFLFSSHTGSLLLSRSPPMTCIRNSHRIAGERCSLFEIWFILLYLFCAYTLYIFVSRIIAAAQRKWNNHICTCREVYIQQQNIYFICNLNGKTIEIHSDDCCLSLRALPVSDFPYFISSRSGTWILCARAAICKS